MERLNIISSSSPEFCCGVMCPRQEVQIRIDRMQAVIDRANTLLKSTGVPEHLMTDLKEELKLLSSD